MRRRSLDEEKNEEGGMTGFGVGTNVHTEEHSLLIRPQVSLLPLLPLLSRPFETVGLTYEIRNLE